MDSAYRVFTALRKANRSTYTFISKEWCPGFFCFAVIKYHDKKGCFLIPGGCPSLWGSQGRNLKHLVHVTGRERIYVSLFACPQLAFPLFAVLALQAASVQWDFYVV